MNDIVGVDFNEKKVVSRLKAEIEEKLPKFLREVAKLAKREDYVGAGIILIDADGSVTFEGMAETSEQLALIALSADDLRSHLKSMIWPEDDE